jgi:hypothetical protein
MKSLLIRQRAMVTHHLHHQLVKSELVPTSPEPDEVLIADPRGRLTSVQMVDQKLTALLGGNYPVLLSQSIGRWGNIRRLPGK